MTREIVEINKPRAWIEMERRKPTLEGWYAVQDDTMSGEYYSDAYWQEGGWWVFGRMAGVMNVRKEVRNVLRWRFQDDAGRQDIHNVAANAVIPRDSGVMMQLSFMRRLWMLHNISTFKLTRKQLVDRLELPRKSVEQMLSAIGTYGVIIGEHRATQVLYVLDWGPINQQWLLDNAKSVHEQIGETKELHGNSTNMARIDKQS